ncbi:MAG: membrane protein [Bacteroidia bacterium]|nr:MAG: membrane protein [Bacteroidia bacterium]
MNEQNRQAERWISFTLRIGVLTSALLLGTGLVVEFLRPHAANEVTDPLEILRAVLSREETPPGMILLSAGLLILMFTPVVRVMTALGTFMLEKDRAFSFVAIIVLVMFILELLISLA